MEAQPFFLQLHTFSSLKASCHLEVQPVRWRSTIDFHGSCGSFSLPNSRTWSNQPLMKWKFLIFSVFSRFRIVKWISNGDNHWDCNYKNMNTQTGSNRGGWWKRIPEVIWRLKTERRLFGRTEWNLLSLFCGCVLFAVCVCVWVWDVIQGTSKSVTLLDSFMALTQQNDSNNVDKLKLNRKNINKLSGVLHGLQQRVQQFSRSLLRLFYWLSLR